MKLLTTNALIQRLNRKLKPSGRRLRKTRPRWRSSLGEFYIHDLDRNFVEQSHVNIEWMAREEKVMAKHEALEE